MTNILSAFKYIAGIHAVKMEAKPERFNRGIIRF